MSLYSTTRPCIGDIGFEGYHLCYQLSGDCLTATVGLAKNRGLGENLFGLWPNMSPTYTFAKSLIKLLLDEADEGSF